MSYIAAHENLLHHLLGDKDIAAYLSREADIAAMVRFETALARAQAGCGVIPAAAAYAIGQAAGSFRPDFDALAEMAARDGLIVAEFVRQLRKHIGEPHNAHLHFGTTSQDVIDTSLILRLKNIATILKHRLAEIDLALAELDSRFGDKPFMGRTRMQDAVPISAGHRIRSWQRPLSEHQERLHSLLPRVLRLQLGGAAGTLDKLGGEARPIAEALAAELDLELPAQCWHTDRSALADLAHWLSLVTGALGKMGQDIALMAQTGIGEIEVSGAGKSSAMPHKNNPVKAEVLIALARYNSILVSGMHHTLVHEQERSGTAWTLEWMVLPQMLIATGAAARTALALTRNVVRIGEP